MLIVENFSEESGEGRGWQFQIMSSPDTVDMLEATNPEHAGKAPRATLHGAPRDGRKGTGTSKKKGKGTSSSRR